MTARKTKKRFHTEVKEIEFQTFQRPIQQNMPPKQQRVNITPRGQNQHTYLNKLLDLEKNIVFAIGPAGTGKTLIACQVGIKLFKAGIVDKIIITRPAVSVEEEHGFLPGTIEQKMAPWTRPVFDVLAEYYYAKEIENMLREGVIEMSPLAYMRGRNFAKAYIIADECQLTTPKQMKMLLTRLSEGSYMVVTGDLDQADRGKDNGLLDFIGRLPCDNAESRISLIKFDAGDIQRHPVVKEVLDIYNK
jgi:phosphate starvation-inducible PhoH-like protein